MNLVFRRGDEFGSVVDFDISLSGYTVSSVITSLVTGDEVLPITTTLANAGAGQVNVSLTETQTASLAVGSYGWRLEWDAPGNVHRTALAGVVEVSA